MRRNTIVHRASNPCRSQIVFEAVDGDPLRRTPNAVGMDWKTTDMEIMAKRREDQDMALAKEMIDNEKSTAWNLSWYPNSMSHAADVA